MPHMHLTFDGSDVAKRRFQRLYEGFCSGADTRDRNIAVLRQEGKIFDKLDAISVENEDARKAGAAPRVLRAGTHSLDLELHEFVMIKANVERTPWIPLVARDIVDLVDWLSAAEKVE